MLPSMILGIDPGFDRAGFGVVREENGEMTWIHHECLQTQSTQPFDERLRCLRDTTLSMIERFHPSVAVIEQLFFTNNAKTALRVGMARGVILLTLGDARISIVELTPNQVKQGVAGWGRADKKQVQEMVRRILKLPDVPKPDDAADALALAIVGWRMYRSDASLHS